MCPFMVIRLLPFRGPLGAVCYDTKCRFSDNHRAPGGHVDVSKHGNAVKALHANLNLAATRLWKDQSRYVPLSSLIQKARKLPGL